MKLHIFSLIIICVLKSIESDSFQDLLQAVTQLEEQLADEYKLAHAAAESWSNKINGVFPKALVNNKVCNKAGEYEKVVIEAQSRVKQYREALEKTGQGDPKEFKALKHSVLQKIEGAKSGYGQAKRAFDRWHAGDRINVKDLLQAVTQLEDQLADEYKLAHAAAETWGDMIKGPIPEAHVHNKVCEKAGEYEEAVIEAQSEVKQYRELLQLTGYGDIEEFADLKRSVLHKINEAKIAYEQAKKAYDSWRTGDRIESVKVKTLLQAVTQLEEQLANEYKLAHVVAQTWINCLKGTYRQPRVRILFNKVCQKAGEYKEVVIEAQSRVKQYREALEKTGQVDLKEFKALKRSVLNKIEKAKSSFERAKKAQERWDAGHRPLSYQVYENRYVIGGVLRNAVAVFGLYALGNAFLGLWNGGQESQIPTAHTFGPIIKLGTPFTSATLSTAASDTTRIVWIASMSIVVLVLLLGGWIVWNRTNGSSKRRHLKASA